MRHASFWAAPAPQNLGLPETEALAIGKHIWHLNGISSPDTP